MVSSNSVASRPSTPQSPDLADVLTMSGSNNHNNNHPNISSANNINSNSSSINNNNNNNNNNSPSFFTSASPPTLFDSFTEFSQAADPHNGGYVSYKTRRKNYRLEKKKLTQELISASQDPTILLLSDWVKVRTTLKQWNKYYVELRPGLLNLYKNQKTFKSSNWIGTIMLKMCELIERPSKKNGFCFKLFHPLEHPIWSPKGPQGEAFTSIMFPLPASYVIFRAPSEESGHKWMTAIELSLRCTNAVHGIKHRDSVTASSAILNNTSASGHHPVHMAHLQAMQSVDRSDDEFGPSHNALHEQKIRSVYNDSEIERHFDDDLCDDGPTDQGECEESQEHLSTEESDDSCFDFRNPVSADHPPTILPATKRNIPDSDSITETQYVFDGGNEEFGLAGDAGQTEDVPEENKSLLWALLKQCRPGMDLSKVVLPTFILEPRSFLEKLTDYYYHCDILSKAAIEDDPLIRMKLVLKWYLSGFYKKPKGLKKPYNPILGETFRCCWEHSETNSRTFYIAEQVSHHPPVSAFYVTNRQDGFCISGSILTKSKFYGNSISAVLEGTAKLTLMSRGEDYLITFPYAHCKGIFLGPMAFELGGKVQISCEKTGYRSDLEFKLKPFFGTEDQSNLVTGKLKLGDETLGIIDGHWDQNIWYKDKRKGDKELFWSGIDSTVKSRRLKRFVVPIDEQIDTESERLWSHVSAAIMAQDQEAATIEKTKLEEAQREDAKQRTIKMQAWEPSLFMQESSSLDWIYKLADNRPWDPRTDVKQYELNFVIRTFTKHLNRSANFLAKKCSLEQIAGTGNGSNSSNNNNNNSIILPKATPSKDETFVAGGSRKHYRRVPSSTKHRSYETDVEESLKAIQSQLNDIKGYVCVLEKENKLVQNQLSDMHSTMNRYNTILGSSKTGPSCSIYRASGIPIRQRMAQIYRQIPAEIRQVIVVLFAHLVFYYVSSYFCFAKSTPEFVQNSVFPSTTENVQNHGTASSSSSPSSSSSAPPSSLPTLDR